MPFTVLLAALLSAQPPQELVPIRPGSTPEGTTPVPISETAEPLGLAIAGFDSDGDARTSRAELNSALARSFAAADTNRDGSLGYIEYSGWALMWLGSQSALPGPFAIDTDGDSRLSMAEFTADFGRHFDRIDTNRDGSVARSELLTVRNPRLPPIRQRAPPRRPVRSGQ